MNCRAIKNVLCLALLCLLSFQLNAEGLTDYLQNTETTDVVSNTIASTTDDSNTVVTSNQFLDSSNLKNIIELVVAGIVAAAMIIVVLVIFLGRWIARKEKNLIKELRIAAEEDSEKIDASLNFIADQEKYTASMTETIRKQAAELSAQQQLTEKYASEIVITNTQIKEHEKEFNVVSDHVSDNMQKIQKYWDSQVNETIDTLSLFQHNLSENMHFANEGLSKVNENKEISESLLQEVLNKYTQQKAIIDSNANLSQKVMNNLNVAYQESNSLIDVIKKQQAIAEQSLSDYSQRLNSFEEQAYEQFDASFQVADLARQELTANVEENRKHIENMRRQEEQSHGINNQIVKNLETLDYSKILKISQTLDTTQDMFDEIHHKVEDTRRMLEELKQIEVDIKQTACNVETVAKTRQLMDSTENEISELSNLIDTAEQELEDTTINSLVPEGIKEEALAEKVDVDMNDTSIDLHNETPQIRDNTTIAITDYKMASGDVSTPLSFFRDIQRNNANKNN